MTREPKLPKGVPTDNAGGPASDGSARGYAAPDTVTPTFVRPASGDSKLNADATKTPRRDLMSREHQNLTLLIAVVALAMAIGGVLLLRTPKPQLMPPCSEQPEWNQFNCRAD